MKGDLSGGMNGTIYERGEPEQKGLYGSMAKPAPMRFETADILLAFAMIAVGFLYWNLIFFHSLDLGVTLFAAVLWAVSAVYFRASGIRQSRSGFAVFGIFVLSAVHFAIFDGEFIKGLNFIFLSLCFVLWVLIAAGKRIEEKISLYLASDMLRQLFVIPFSNFIGCFAGIRQVFASSRRGKGVLSGILGIVIFLPVLLVVTGLLSSADAAFEGIMAQIRFSVSENIMEYLLQLILGLPVACYLYGMLYGNRYQRKVGAATLDSVNRNLAAFRFAPGATVYSAMTALNLVYVVFFLAQMTYLFSAFEGILPQAMTYAEYARGSRE